MAAAQRRFEGGLEQTVAARDWIGALLAAHGVVGDEVDAFRLAVTEAATNIFRHAYAGKIPAAFELRVEVEMEAVITHILDEGQTFAPGEVRAPDPEALAEGGYGLFLIHSLMDEVSFTPATPRGTVLRMKKHRRPHA